MRLVIALAMGGMLAACGSQARETRTSRVWTTGGGFSASPDYEGPADSTGDFGPAGRSGTPEPGGTEKPVRGR